MSLPSANSSRARRMANGNVAKARAARVVVALIACAVTTPALVAPALAGPVKGAPGSRHHAIAAAPVQVIAWGDNSAGELGNQTLTSIDKPDTVHGLSGVKAVAAGGRHELAIVSNGTVVAWGDDTFGQLGNGIASANGNSEIPIVVSGLAGVTAVAAGDEHSLALLANGTVMAWGDNEQGQLGNGSTLTSARPKLVPGLTGVTAIAAGSLFSLALLKNGTVMAWGSNRFGQLGDGTLTDRHTPVAVKGLTGVKAIAGGGQFAMALLSNGTVMSWGDNESSQLGDGKDVTMQPKSTVPVAVVNLTGVQKIAAGSSHAVALTATGTVWSWGDNGSFQLARSNGFPGGIPNSDVPLTIPGVGKSSAIAAGAEFSLAAVAGGKVQAWGDNAFGQLGNGTTVTGIPPVTVNGATGVTALAAGGVQSLALTTTPVSMRTVPASSPWQVTSMPVQPTMSTTGLKDVIFRAVSSSGPAEAWAVGASDALLSSRPLAEHWNGHSWTLATVPVPAGATDATLLGVREVSPTNVWAVGSINSGNDRTLIEHFDGTRWAIVPSPNPATGAGAFDQLTAIAGTSATDLWAVGTFSNGVFITFLFEHWNGKAWTFVPGPVSGDFATAVTAISPTDAWAVGDNLLNGATISEHWNGKAWSIVTTPFLQDGKAPSNFLTGVAATGSNNVWASGYEGNVNQLNFALPYVLHWNGTAWSLIKVPNVGTEGSQLRGVTAIAANDVWAAGETLTADGGILTLTEHFNGTSWAIAPSLTPGSLQAIPDSSFNAIASMPPHTVFAVGAQELPTICCLLALAEHSTKG